MRSLPPLVAAIGLILAACDSAGVSEEMTAPTSTLPTPTSSAATKPPRPVTEDGPIPAHLQPMADAWDTDFSRATIDLGELQVGIPARDPRDLIPPIDDPVFAPVADTNWIADREPGVLLEMGDEARFYPLAVLTRHEIVNDEMGGLPVAVTYCPLCNTAMTFDRRVDGSALRFGVSGLLRNSDLVMWDDLTESLWQQITGEAIVGELAGKRLEAIPAAIVRWADFAQAHPDGLAMSEDQGFRVSYGVNPYEFYSSRDRPFGAFFQGEIDDRLPALERVIGVTLETGDKAYPFSTLQETGVANDEIGGTPVLVLWGAADTADALDSADIAAATAVGTGVAYDPVVEGKRLTFRQVDDTTFQDEETGSTWTILGEAIAGDLEGAQLALLPHRNDFWFAWQAFFPDAELYQG